MDRRTLLGVLGAGFAYATTAPPADASTVRGLTLEELSRESERILLATALDSESRWATVGRRRRIVTDTRVRVDDLIAKTRPRDSEVMVRTLGGTVGDVGAIVHGEAMLALHEACLVFLRELPDGLHRVTGMAQGHYPVRADTQRVLRLRPSPQSSEVLDGDRTALRRLVGREIGEARSLIRKALGQ